MHELKLRNSCSGTDNLRHAGSTAQRLQRPSVKILQLSAQGVGHGSSCLSPSGQSSSDNITDKQVMTAASLAACSAAVTLGVCEHHLPTSL